MHLDFFLADIAEVGCQGGSNNFRKFFEHTTDQSFESWLLSTIGVHFSQSPSTVLHGSKIDSERTSGLFKPDQPPSVDVPGAKEAARGGLHQSVCYAAQEALYLLVLDSFS